MADRTQLALSIASPQRRSPNTASSIFLLHKKQISVVVLIYTCYGTFYNLFLVWEETSGFAFLRSVLFLVSYFHVLLALNTANFHFDAQYTRTRAAQQNLSLSGSVSWPYYAVLDAKQMKDLHFIDQIWLLRGKTPVLTSLGPFWICTSAGKRRL